MLIELRVFDVALIERASLDFSPGLNVLTGETGAGKTALLIALKLLIGERADLSYIRDGASELRAEALFSAQLDGADVEYLATRRVGLDGRSRCVLQDEMVTVKALNEKLGPLVDLCGQHEHQSLLRPEAHREALDAFGGAATADALKTYQKVLQDYRAAHSELKRLETAACTSSLKREQAAFVVREIQVVNPLEGEYEELEAQLPRLRHGEELALTSDGAYQALREEGFAIDALARAQQELTRSRLIDPKLETLAAQLDEVLVIAEDLAVQLRSYRDDVEFDPEALGAALDRLGQLEGLKKRFGPRMEDVFTAQNDAKRILGETENIEERRLSATTELKRARMLLENAAARLAEKRAQAASAFAEALTEALRGLAMGDVAFSFDIQLLDFDTWTAQGSCRYELRYQPTLASVPRPLAKIASGGELSRIMLAYKTIVHETDSPLTLIFDEIDAGIGGVTATAIAQRLSDLAQQRQVIVVTHLAQIAAMADTHWVVEKHSTKETVTTGIRRVTGESRVDEIARMLSGNRGDVAREHARQLLGGH